MRKPRLQTSLATLTPEEKEQLAAWLRKDHYDAVLNQVRKPKPESGLGLAISKKPLQTFYTKVLLLDALNARLPDDRKLTLAEFESIASSDRLLAQSISTEENPECEPVHSAIIDATSNLVTSGDSTPAQLLTLQRLADFPERAELRARKEERQYEEHSWKSELHLLKREMHLHKLDMDAHRKHINTERLALAKRLFELREQCATGNREKPSSLPPGHYIDANGRECDDLGPIPRSFDDHDAISARARKKFGIRKRPNSGSPDGSSVQSIVSLEPLEQSDTPPLSSEPLSVHSEGEAGSPSLPEPHFAEANVSSDDKPTNNVQLLPNSSSSVLSPHPLAAAVSKSPSEAPSPNSGVESRPSDVVISHAIRRWRSYQPRRYQDPEPTNSWNDECPCGIKIPCEKHGYLWNFVRYIKPFDPEYAAHLKKAGIPYYIPTKDELTRSEPTDVPCTSPFYVKKPALQQFADGAD